jgi:hypothetical protein
MSVRAVNHQSDHFMLQHSARTQAFKLGEPSSFAMLLGGPASKAEATSATVQPATQAATGSPVLFSNYIPATPNHAASTQATSTQSSAKPAAVTAADTAPVNSFSPTFEQGAYVTGPGGVKTDLNPAELATSGTASRIAQMLGGTVVDDLVSQPFASSVPTREISVPGSNVEINAGLAAGLFATYGTAQGSQAWLTINRDLGRDPMATGPVS